MFLFGISIFAVGCSDISEGDFSSSEGIMGETSSTGADGNQSGLITAGEWNDLNNWNFWTDIISKTEFKDFPELWNFYNNNRISIELTNNSNAVVNAQIELFKNGILVWEAKSDHKGKAELWIGLYDYTQEPSMNDYSIAVNGQELSTNLKLYHDGVNRINISNAQNVSNKLEIAFIVDATSSMNDEIRFLKSDLEDVLERAEADNPGIDLWTGSVFYRDLSDEYIVRKSDFTNDIKETRNFIKDQSGGGGGDYPEAVDLALEMGIEELQWSDDAKSRLVFLMLDAPPHREQNNIELLHTSIESAARKGIKIIPITASGIDKETEFLMRFFSMSTNSTYTFITNHSGIGDDHIEASVGEYEVEFLNDLMVRLINQYAE